MIMFDVSWCLDNGWISLSNLYQLFSMGFSNIVKNKNKIYKSYTINMKKLIYTLYLFK